MLSAAAPKLRISAVATKALRSSRFRPELSAGNQTQFPVDLLPQAVTKFNAVQEDDRPSFGGGFGQPGAGKAKPKQKRVVSASARAGLQFPVGRLRRWMKESAYGFRIGGTAPTYMAAVMEYMTAEVLFACLTTSFA